MAEFIFRKKNRLNLKRDITKVFKKGKSIKNKNFVIYYLENNFSYSRLCIIATKKFGNSVKRNRIRRLTREFFRLNQKKFRTGYDLIIIIGRYNRIKNYKQTEQFLYRTFVKHGLFKKN